MGELRCRVILEPEEEGGFSADPGFSARAHSRRYAGRSARERPRGHRPRIGYLMERGLPIPESDTPDAPMTQSLVGAAVWIDEAKSSIVVATLDV